MSYANALGHVGRFDEAREVVGRAVVLSPGATEKGYILFHERVMGPHLVRPHIAGLIAAGIFKGD
jgi:hypothetical protein